MKRTMPNFRPLNTTEVWYPWYVDSRTTSRHHWNIVNASRRTPIVIGHGPKEWNQAARPAVKLNAPKAPIRGQGLYSTR